MVLAVFVLLSEGTCRISPLAPPPSPSSTSYYQVPDCPRFCFLAQAQPRALSSSALCLIVQAHTDGSLPFAQQSDLGATLRNAVITDKGALTPNYAYINTLRATKMMER